jgi:CARDB
MITLSTSTLRHWCALAALGLAACAAPGDARDGDEAAGERTSALCKPWPSCQVEDPPPPPPPTPRPNLKIVFHNGAPNDPSSDYCDPDLGRWVWFQVFNDGVADAPASTVRFTIASGGYNYYVPPLVPGDAAFYSLQIDASHPGDSSFSIRADYYHVVSEGNESDNYAAGYCIG